MKKLLTILIMLFTISSISQEQHRIGNYQFGNDKLWHSFAGVTIHGQGYAFYSLNKEHRNPYMGSLLALCASVLKESVDLSRGGSFNCEDVLWTWIPALTIDVGISIFKKRNKPIIIEDDYNPPLVKKN